MVGNAAAAFHYARKILFGPASPLRPRFQSGLADDLHIPLLSSTGCPASPELAHEDHGTALSEEGIGLHTKPNTFLGISNRQ